MSPLIPLKRRSRIRIEEVTTLREVLQLAGYSASDSDVEWAWQQHSDASAATWLIFDDLSDDTVVKHLLEHLIEDHKNNL